MKSFILGLQLFLYINGVSSTFGLLKPLIEDVSTLTCKPNLAAQKADFTDYVNKVCCYKVPEEICSQLKKNGGRPSCIRGDVWKHYKMCFEKVIGAHDWTDELQRFFFIQFFSITDQNKCPQWTPKNNLTLPSWCTSDLTNELSKFGTYVHQRCCYKKPEQICRQFKENHGRPDCIPPNDWKNHYSCLGSAAGSQDWSDEIQRVFYSQFFNGTFECYEKTESKEI